MPDIDFTLPAGEWDGFEGGEKLDVAKAASLIRQRLGYNSGGWATHHVSDQEALSLALAGLIPEALRTESIINNMDLRTLLAPVMSTETQAKSRGDITVNSQTFSPALQMLAGAAYVDIRTKQREILEQQLVDAGFSPDEIPDLARQELEQWRQHRNSLVRIAAPAGQVIADPTTGALQTAGANKDTTDFATMLNQIVTGQTTDASQAPAFLTPDDLRLMFRDQSPNTAIGGYMTDLQQRQQAAALGLVPTAPRDMSLIQFEEGLERPTPYMRPGANQATRDEAAARTGNYTLTQALSLPNDMTRQEVQALTDKMEKAGIFAQVGGSPFVKGDPNDPQFREGYRLLLSKSIQRGAPVSAVLQADALAYDEALEENVRARLTDPARIRASTDSLGRQILGRKLSAAEQATLVKTIHDLEKKQAVAEADTEGGDVTEVDWEARMGEFIRNANAGEAGAHDIAGQFDAFRSMIGGR